MTFVVMVGDTSILNKIFIALKCSSHECDTLAKKGAAMQVPRAVRVHEKAYILTTRALTFGAMHGAVFDALFLLLLFVRPMIDSMTRTGFITSLDFYVLKCRL